MKSLLETHRKTLAALLLAFMASVMLPACSSSEEEETSNKDELCDEADAGAQGCPD